MHQCSRLKEVVLIGKFFKKVGQIAPICSGLPLGH